MKNFKSALEKFVFTVVSKSFLLKSTVTCWIKSVLSLPICGCGSWSPSSLPRWKCSRGSAGPSHSCKQNTVLSCFHLAVHHFMKEIIELMVSYWNSYWNLKESWRVSLALCMFVVIESSGWCLTSCDGRLVSVWSCFGEIMWLMAEKSHVQFKLWADMEWWKKTGPPEHSDFNSLTEWLPFFISYCHWNCRR